MKLIALIGLTIASLLAPLAATSQAQPGIRITLPRPPDIRIELPRLPRLVVVPDAPQVTYAPDQRDYFRHGGQYWVYRNGHWYTSRRYNGRYVYVANRSVPRVVIRQQGRDHRRSFVSPAPVQVGLRLDASHTYEAYDRSRGVYGRVAVDAVPQLVQQGAWIYDRTAQVWVSHPSVGQPNPNYNRYGRRNSDRRTKSSDSPG